MDSLDAFAGTYNEKLVQLAQEKRVPISGTFELLPTCNMRCKMCYIQHAPAKNELQKPDFWVELFEQTIAEGMLFPLLTGGEPLLYPWFHELYERLIRLPIHMCINTNGTLLDRETVAWLAKQPPRRLNISLYGASDETYARLCSNPNGFTQVMRAFELLREYGIPFRVHSPMVPENEGDYQAIIDICNRLQLPLNRAYYMFPAYRKDNGEMTTDGRFSPTEMAKVAMRYKTDILHKDTREYKQFILLNSQAQITPQIYTAYGYNHIDCKSGKCTFWVDWRGSISGCGMHNQLAYDLHEVSFKDAWQRIVKDTENIRISEKCKFCKYRSICPVCPAACFCETGKMDGTPEYLCQYCEAFGAMLMDERKRLFGDQ
ncbi:MAG: radical SAM protein [Clostridia bacterium]|nr:radical SAM protein [Clostridia bacterium]